MVKYGKSNETNKNLFALDDKESTWLPLWSIKAVRNILVHIYIVG